jgi:leucyl aminopeptidase
VKRVQLAAGAVSRPNDDYLVILTDKEGLEQLAGVCRPEELQFARQAGERDVNCLFFPRETGNGVFVRIFAAESDGQQALEDVRLAGNELLRDLRHYKAESVTLRTTGPGDRLLAFAEGMALGSYQFLKHFSQPDKKENSLRTIHLEDVQQAVVDELDAVLEAVCLTRDLVNEPQSHLDSVQFAAAVAALGEQYGFSVEVLDQEQIESLRMGGLVAVNRASSTPPQFCILEWKPDAAASEQPVALIGKGVTYDTGGLSLKPTDGMDYMKCDMAGAAAVVGAFVAAAKTNLPVHLLGLLPMTDNRLGERAMAPGDVIRMYSGKTVEVVNTDAEGRLILADALCYAKKYNPVLVIDLATLTGAAVRALGSQAICYMGTAPRGVKEAIEASGWATFERLIELPLWKEYGDELKSAVADLRNIGSGNAGMITAGKFLEHFADFPWLHLDIAGPAYLRTPNGYRTKEGTGVGVRLLFDFLKKGHWKEGFTV